MKAKTARNICLGLTLASIMGTYVCLHSAKVIDNNITLNKDKYSNEEIEELKDNKNDMINAGLYGLSTTVLFGIASGVSGVIDKDNQIEK